MPTVNPRQQRPNGLDIELDRIVKGLQIAQGIFGIPVAYEQLQKAQRDEERQLQQLEISKRADARSQKELEISQDRAAREKSEYERNQRGELTDLELLKFADGYDIREVPKQNIPGVQIPAGSRTVRGIGGKEFALLPKTQKTESQITEYVSGPNGTIMEYVKTPQGSFMRPIQGSEGSEKIGAAAERTKEGVKKENDLYDDWKANPVTKASQEIEMGYNKVSSASPGGVGDAQRVYGFIKLLDPTTGIKEGETKMIQATASIPEWAANIWNKVAQGGQLSDKQREQIYTESSKIVGAQRALQKKQDEFYIGKAIKYGVDPSNVVHSIQADPIKPDFGRGKIEERVDPQTGKTSRWRLLPDGQHWEELE